ncbi:hypothetical protein AAV99_12150 [Aurantiacibacter marinus]|uniref:Uncharacterized protein n=1 Tax=Aurantiacibacter marinus TaxID=874156 RepID=A0A0H0XLX1_9SPHN|nr:hypothetical protein AAV99_12150 [Aurantiacibacter marinus]
MIVLETIWLLWRGWRLSDVALLLLPAVLMLIALRAALVGAPWPWIAVPLALSFPVHLLDLSRRNARRD